MRALPDYAWASAAPHAASVESGPWQHGLPPVRHSADPGELPDGPTDAGGPLVRVAHVRIRVLAAYWHEGWPYSRPTAWLRPETTRQLEQAVESLPVPFGLAVWDAWRDPRLQAVLHDTVYADDSLPPGFVAYPDPDPRRCPPHATGGTVDLTLTWRHVPLALGTRFDAFVPAAAADALEPDGPPLERDLRRLLSAAMSGAGFVGHPQEWWHWEHGTRWWAAVRGHPVRFGPAAPPEDPGARSTPIGGEYGEVETKG